MLADLDGTREGQLAHVLMCHEAFGNMGRVAPDEIETAVGQSRLLHQPSDRHHSGRRLARSLDDHRAAGRERRRNFPDRLAERKIPRCYRNTDTNWLAPHHLSHARIACGNDTAVDAASLLGMPVSMIRGRTHFRDRLAKGLALIERDVARDRFHLGPDKVREAPQDSPPFKRGAVFPIPECSICGIDRHIEVVVGRPGEAADGLARRRVDDIERFAALRIDPFRADAHTQRLVGNGRRFDFVRMHRTSCLDQVRAFLRQCLQPSRSPA